jgi:16S rRNA (uracil1498-N3)-methyltransferase
MKRVRRARGAPPPTSGTARPPAAVHRFFVDDPPAAGEAILAGALAHRVTHVLRLRVGDVVHLFDGSGRSWSGRIAARHGGEVQVAVGDATVHAPEPWTVLCAALIRPNRFEWLIEKATELGASEVRPVITAHTSIRPDEIGRARLERWRRIAVEAAEQCGRVTVPSLHEPEPLAGALAGLDGRLIVATEPAHGDARPLGAVLRGVGDEPVTFLTGPEGGLTADEVRAALEAGGVAASLGPLVLRSETAAIACLAILQDARQVRDGVHADS